MQCFPQKWFPLFKKCNTLSDKMISVMNIKILLQLMTILNHSQQVILKAIKKILWIILKPITASSSNYNSWTLNVWQWKSLFLCHPHHPPSLLLPCVSQRNIQHFRSGDLEKPTETEIMHICNSTHRQTHNIDSLLNWPECAMCDRVNETQTQSGECLVAMGKLELDYNKHESLWVNATGDNEKIIKTHKGSLWMNADCRDAHWPQPDFNNQQWIPGQLLRMRKEWLRTATSR